MMSSKLSVIATILLLMLYTAADCQTSDAWHPDHFIISFWCGPPAQCVTLERYQQITDAGFNTIMPSISPPTPKLNAKILAIAKQAHLKVFIQDSRMPTSLNSPNARKHLDAIVADYSSSPALAGYFLFDEPQPSAFAGLGQVVKYLRQKDPKHPAFINLLPNCSSGGTPMRNYPHYVSSYIDTVHPSFISYDHYHFLKTGDGPFYLQNLQTIHDISIENDLSFLNIVLVTQHKNYRKLTEAEKRYEAMQTVAFGAHGLLWFTYWQPDPSGYWGDAIINFDGTPTAQYAQVRRINHDLSALGNALLHADLIKCWTDKPPAKVVTISNAKVHWTVSLFQENQMRYLFLANQDYRHAASSDLVIPTGGAALQQLNLKTGKFIPAKSNHLELGPAEAALYRWTQKE
ncbi:MAG TPA: hypothetical protein VG722_02390 [Tepidisphaeraceae bacterium]|nr:hypothetical protein [Tepidisphaeraceae bacterium]